MVARVVQQILPVGIAPTGLGLVLMSDETIRFTSACCDCLFEDRGQSVLDPKWSISAWCTNCNVEYTKLMFDTTAVLYHFGSRLDSPDMRWLSAGLGYPREDLKVVVTRT
jgi:hypothetical protein